MRRIHVALLAVALTLPACGGAEEMDPSAKAEKIKNDLAEADTRFRNAKEADAEKLYLRVLDLDPSNAKGLAGLGRVRMSSKNYTKAEELLTKAAANDPQDAKIQATLGSLYDTLERPAEAATAYGKAFSLDGNDSQYGLSYAINLKKSKQYSEAEPILVRVSELDPQVQFVWTELADVRRELGRLDEALKTYMKAQTTWASDKMARAGAAIVYERQGDIRHAIDEWSHYIRMDCCSEFSNNVAKKKIMELKVPDSQLQAENKSTKAPPG